jgi:hypothetical protein
MVAKIQMQVGLKTNYFALASNNLVVNKPPVMKYTGPHSFFNNGTIINRVHTTKPGCSSCGK